MSLSSDGRQIMCDGDICGACAPVPVALPSLSALSNSKSPTTNWLYVQMNGTWRHYCPNCAVNVRLEHPENTGASSVKRKLKQY